MTKKYVPFYHGIIKNTIAAFGSLFSNIKIERREGDSVRGKKKQVIKVPIVYSPKEKWYNALTSNPDKDDEVAYTLPRMGFEILGLTYDSTRKTTRSMTISCTTEDGRTSVENASPWNMEVGLYVVSNKTEDVLQIIEQILPTFNPDYTMNIRTIDELSLVTAVPVSLQSIAIEDSYQGEYGNQRLIVYTLSFVIKMSVYGRVLTTPIITEVHQKFDDAFEDIWNGDVKTGEITHTRVHLDVESEDSNVD